MSAPRQILPGTTYLITRRCSQRQFLLRPSAITNAIFLFVLAVAARRFGIEVHAFCVMSNHFHLVVTDPFARLPAFSQYLDSQVARAVNASLGRWDSFWESGSYSAVALTTPADIVSKVAYALANPVAAALVRRGRDWPGLRSGIEQFGTPIAAARPGVFFRQEGSLPPTVALQLVAPPGFESIDGFRAEVASAVKELEDAAAHAVNAEGRGFLGVARVLAQNPRGRPSTREPRRGLNPRVAARDKWKRIEVLSRVVEFVDAYRRAWRARRAGAKDFVFPAGTYLLRIAHGVPCAAPA